ncbi:unnamed protein product [Chrysoparadoxa australica]
MPVIEELESVVHHIPEKAKFVFSSCPPIPSFANRDVKDKLTQWGLEGSFSCHKLSFTGAFRPQDQASTDAFIRQALSEALPGADGSVQYKELKCTQLSMKFFKPMTDRGIVTETGYIRGCFDEDIHGITVQDKLRTALATPPDEREEEGVFSAEEEDELLYQVFKALVVGGSMCQPEVQIDPYLETTKAVYKDLLEVHKSANEQVVVSSHAYRIMSVQNDECQLFKQESPHNLCILVVNPLARTATVIHKNFTPFW